MEVQKLTKDNMFEPLRAVVYGPRGSGKTSVALTLSAKCPENVALNTKPVELDDLFFILFDEGGLDTVAGYNISVPYINLAGIAPDKIEVEFHKALDTAKQRAKDGVTKSIIIDTYSSWDQIQEFQCVTEAAGGNTQRSYGKLAESHSKAYYRATVGNPANLLVLCHAKFLIESDDKKNESQTAPGKPEVIPQITGKGASKWLNNVSLELPLLASTVNGKVTREFYTKTYAGWEAKVRGSTSLAPKEPADFRTFLKKLKGS